MNVLENQFKNALFHQADYYIRNSFLIQDYRRNEMISLLFYCLIYIAVSLQFNKEY